MGVYIEANIRGKKPSFVTVWARNWTTAKGCRTSETEVGTGRKAAWPTAARIRHRLARYWFQWAGFNTWSEGPAISWPGRYKHEEHHCQVSICGINTALVPPPLYLPSYPWTLLKCTVKAATSIHHFGLSSLFPSFTIDFRQPKLRHDSLECNTVASEPLGNLRSFWLLSFLILQLLASSWLISCAHYSPFL